MSSDWRAELAAYKAKKAGVRTVPAAPKRRRGPVYVQPDDDLVWLHHRAATELGMQASPLDGGGVPDPARPRSVPEHRIRAAARAREIRAALAQLDPHQQATIEACYGHRFAPLVESNAVQQMALRNDVVGGDMLGRWLDYQRLAKEHGIAAGAIERALRPGRADGGEAPSGTGYTMGGKWEYFDAEEADAEDPTRTVVVRRRRWKPGWVSTSAPPVTLEDASQSAVAAALRRRDAERRRADRGATERAVVAVCEAHEAWRAAREQQAKARREQRDRAKAAREAQLRQLLGLDERERRAEVAREVMGEMGVEVEP